MSRRAAAALLLTACFTALPLLGAKLPPPPTGYEDGVTAYDAADYALTVDKMKQALAKDSSEGLAKFQSSGGLNKVDYFPHFYLGVSLDKLGRGEEAYTHLKESQRQGIIRMRGSTNLILERTLTRLEALRTAQLRPTTAPVPPTAVVKAVPPTATPAPPPPPTAAASAQPTATRPPAVPPTEVVIVAHPTAKPSPTAAADEEEGVSSSVMAGVREGVRSYFKGDYPSAIRQLTQHVELVPLARLFLAYSLAATELLKPARDPVAVQRARQEYAAARKDGAPTRNEELISPAIRAMLTGKS